MKKRLLAVLLCVTAAGLLVMAGGAKRAYGRGELTPFILQLMMTVTVEFLLALPFGYRRPQQLAIIVSVNYGTQTVLHRLLDLYRSIYGGGCILVPNGHLRYFHFYVGDWDFVLWYLTAELFIFAIEASVFALTLHNYANEVPGKNPPTRARSVIYALVANAASLAVGMLIASLIPWIF